MRKKVFGVTILLVSLLSLPACMVRMAGPCLGYGCPVGTGTSSASNGAPKTQQASVTTAREATAPDSAARAGK